MPAVADARFDALRAQGFTGAVSDMYMAWLLNRTMSAVPAVSIPDAERAYLISELADEGATTGTNSDLWFALLRARGLTGSLTDMMLAFWIDQYIGPDLVTNGNFFSNANNWTLTNFTWQTGAAPNGGTVFSTAAGNILQTIASLVAGRTYRVRWIQAAPAGNVTVSVNGGTASAAQVAPTGWKSVDVVAGATGTTLRLTASAVNIILDRISCREVL